MQSLLLFHVGMKDLSVLLNSCSRFAPLCGLSNCRLSSGSWSRFIRCTFLDSKLQQRLEQIQQVILQLLMTSLHYLQLTCICHLTTVSDRGALNVQKQSWTGRWQLSSATVLVSKFYLVEFLHTYSNFYTCWIAGKKQHK